MKKNDDVIIHVITATVIAAICIGIGCKPRKNSASVKEGPGGGSFTPLVGGACSTSGQFTQDALRQAHIVREKLQAFMEDKN